MRDSLFGRKVPRHGATDALATKPKERVGKLKPEGYTNVGVVGVVRRRDVREGAAPGSLSANKRVFCSSRGFESADQLDVHQRFDRSGPVIAMAGRAVCPTHGAFW